MNYVTGTVKKIIFSSKDGFTVGLLKIKDTNDQDIYGENNITFTGLFHELNIDEDYKIYGEAIINPKYGFQFKVSSYEKIMPEDKDGLVVFLSSDIFPGVGEKTAKLIVETLGDDCLNLIQENYENLLLVPKMTDKQAQEIQSKLIKYNSSFETIVYLTNIGFSMKDSLKIYNHYLDDSKRVIENNPYELIDTIDSINFNKIDELKNKIDIKIDDERRILALIIHLIELICFQNGDTYVLFEDIYNAYNSMNEKNISEEELEYYLVTLNKLGKLIIMNNKYVLSKTYNNENYISEFIYYLINKKEI